MSEPIASIILPTYNGLKYLSGAIDSCLQQSFRSFELLVVDDASTDGTLSALKAYAAADDRVKVIRHEVNKGLPSALNTGHKAARGTYISWTSDDNVLKPNFLSELVTFLDGREHVDFVYSDFDVIDSEGCIVERVNVEPPEAWFRPGAKNASFLYRRSMYLSVGAYDVDMVLCEDWDYWIRAYKKHRLAPLNVSLYEYRAHGASLSSTRQAEQLLAAEKLWRRHVKDLPAINRKNRAEVWMFLAYASARRGQLASACLASVKTLLTDPGVFTRTALKAPGKITFLRSRGRSRGFT